MEPSKKILIIEDELDFLKIYQDLLSSKGYQVLTATEGNYGIKLIYEEMPDLILLDLVIPGKTGNEILETIKQDPKTKAIPVIIFSVLDTTDKIEQAMKLGAVDYLIKGSVKPSEIIYKIHTVLGGETKNESDSIILQLENQVPNTTKIAKFLGLESNLNCPSCLKTLALELIPDNTRSDGHWFAAHLVCQSCHKII